MRQNAHIMKRQFNGIQLVVTIPKHFAQACGLWGNGLVAFKVNDAGQLIIEPHPPGANSHDHQENQLDFDRPTHQQASR